jgi:hypothetical protein
MMATNQQVRQTHNGILVETRNNQYAFPYVFGDEIRGGSKADIEGTVVYGGDSLSKHYIDSYDLSEVPETVIDALPEDVTLLDNVDGGWASWDGRPEFSTSYVDIGEAEEV